MYLFKPHWKLVPVGLASKREQTQNNHCAKLDLFCWIFAMSAKQFFPLNGIGLICLDIACFQLYFSQNGHMAVYASVRVDSD